jgi:ADP-ribose pyrophosphatase YjhB (NUDIX family)
MIQSTSAGGVVLNPEGKVAVVLQGGKTWSLPKGHVESGESPLQAAKREIREECGLSNLTLVRELGSYKRDKATRHRGRKEIKTIHMFLFRTGEDVLKPMDRMITECRWVEKEKTVSLLTNARDKEFFAGILEELD